MHGDRAIRNGVSLQAFFNHGRGIPVVEKRLERHLITNSPVAMHAIPQKLFLGRGNFIRTSIPEDQGNEPSLDKLG